MVSALSFGTMTLRDHGDEVEGKISRGEEAYELLEACYKGGVNFFDCAVSVRPASASLGADCAMPRRATAAPARASACWASASRRA